MGHHIQCTGRRSNRSSTPYSSLVSTAENRPAARPIPAPASRSHPRPGPPPANGNNGPAPNKTGRHAIAVTHATTTGMKERGRHSNNSSSTAKRAAATGVPKMPVMPDAAPATKRVFRSPALRWKSCANKEPMAPPVMMIGPSAPNGPPVPMEMAEEMGFSTATFGDMRLPPIRMASMASGMPWPRIFSDPKRAISPITNPPSMGAATIQGPRTASAMGCASVPRRPNHTRLVTAPISFTRNQAAKAPPVPITRAMAASINSRGSARKSANARGAKPPGVWSACVSSCIMQTQPCRVAA